MDGGARVVPRGGAVIGRPRVIAVAFILFVTPLAPAAGMAADRYVLDWDSGTGKSYVIPAAEIVGFVAALNAFDRLAIDEDTYGIDGHSIWKNLHTAPEFDKDPFSINQIGHPYQGSIYYGLGRSAGLNYWESLAGTLLGSFLWETAGETTKPSLNDYVTTTLGGSFVGEAMFRMASLLLEGGGETPGIWRELGAAVLSPGMGFNRLVFGERFKPVFPSHDPAVFIRLRIGATLTTSVTNANLSPQVREQEGSLDFYMTYGLPGKPGYNYKRPFDFFLFEFTAVPNANTAADAIENVTIRGLLLGTKYGVGDDYRGLWGLFGGYEYLAPQVFRVATTNFALGTIGQWWLTRTVALQGTALLGVGFGAAGTAGDREERDFRYGVIPEPLVGLRLIISDIAMLEAQGRQYWVVGVGKGASPNADLFGHELIQRANVGLTVRVYGPHALSLSYVVSSRDARVTGVGDRHQSVETVTLSYNFLGHTRFGAVEWRPSEMARR
jgi:Domain of unknown function (DUF3943)